MQEREREVLALLDRYGLMPLARKRILEIGCGTGKWLRDLVGWGADPANVFGIDLLLSSVARARRLCPAGVTISCANAADLRFEPESFDLVLQSTAFTSVLDAGMRTMMAAEMLRVVRPDGLILWYDLRMRNPLNPHTVPIAKAEVHRLFPSCSIDLRRVSLAPPVARALAPCSWLLCCLLARVAPLRSHYLGAIRRRKPGR